MPQTPSAATCKFTPIGGVHRSRLALPGVRHNSLGFDWRNKWSVVAGCMLFALPVAVGNQRASLPQPPACTVTEASRWILSDSAARPLYVEPSALVASGGEILLAGTPNYSYQLSASGAMIATIEDTIFGVVTDGLSRTTLIPKPVDGRVMSIRAAARGAGGWDVVFAELPRAYEFPQPEFGLRLWHGVLNGARWGALTPIATPEGVVLRSIVSTAVVATGDTLAWAMMYDAPNMDAVAVFERVGGTWSHKLLPIDAASAVTLLHTARDGIVLLPVAPDVATSINHAVHIYPQRTGWQRGRLLLHGSENAAITVHAADGEFGPLLAYRRSLDDLSFVSAAYAQLAAQQSGEPTQVLLADTAKQAFVLKSERGVPHWVVNRSGQSGPGELRIFAQRGGAVRLERAMPNPFTGIYNAIEFGRDTILIVGPQLQQSGDGPPLASLFLRIASRCPLQQPVSALPHKRPVPQQTPSTNPPSLQEKHK
jgi:hypothetical protein